MKTTLLDLERFRQQYQQEAFALRESFKRTGDGGATIRRRSQQVESLIRLLWAECTAGYTNGPIPIALVATGGFGRKELFPFSDVDVLFLCANESVEREYHDTIRICTQAMWDIGLRASPATRTLKECDKVDPDNLEFTISLLERRLVTGDRALYDRLESELLPAATLREARVILENVAQMARARHAKYGNTIFHLEPNIKECPGGLRDYNLAQWLTLLKELQEKKSWPRSSSAAIATVHNDLESAFDFLAATRCFLHYRSGRDDNTLDWQAQDEAAAASIGLETRGSVNTAYWMRTYYRHARQISRRANLLLQDWVQDLPQAQRSFYKQFRRKRSAITGTSFFVEDNRISLDEGATLGGSTSAADAESLLRVFALVANHGYKFSQEAEERIVEAIPALAVQVPEGPFLWNCLRDVLLGPFAAHALRTMHALGLLELIIPEFHGIDSLVIRDAYHRYTVDEHTFLVIENVHALRQPHHDYEKRLATLLPQLERTDLFFLALLMHDTGKARRSGDHASQSVELAESLFARLEFDPEERETVRRLITIHLEMSLAMRRDIFDPENVRDFATRIGSQQQLKMLTLLTYADIKAVNPDALTPWKAENLWQLYIASANFLDRSIDESRYHVDEDPGLLNRILALVPERTAELRSFLEGLPQRYLETRLPEQIRTHFEMALALNANTAAPAEYSVQVAFRTLRQFAEVTLITRDRPLLFADIAGVLSAWGMNIVKADAYSNAAGVILDSFQFTDPFRTLELNPDEGERFLSSIRKVAARQMTVEKLLSSRRRPHARTDVHTAFHFDDASSTHSTLLQVVAPDSPGLLRDVATSIAECGCDIQVALVDTEGEIAIDVFYLTHSGHKLDQTSQTCLADKLAASL